MLYEMATGQVPYQAETPIAVVLKHVTAPLPLPSSLKPDIPSQVERVILKAMAKDPDDRFQTVGEMVTALDAGEPMEMASITDPWYPWYWPQWGGEQLDKVRLTSEVRRTYKNLHPQIWIRLPTMAYEPSHG
jgi:serine/threonine protein kinase